MSNLIEETNRFVTGLLTGRPAKQKGWQVDGSCVIYKTKRQATEAASLSDKIAPRSTPRKVTKYFG